ncbi:MAG TPA: hypothetical protein VM285_02295 [Polyangia bacterium]|nr:hypothetical protein [Polyangia bacterium]
MTWTHDPPNVEGLWLRGGPGADDKVKLEPIGLDVHGDLCFLRWAGDLGRPTTMVPVAGVAANLRRYWWLKVPVVGT